MANVSLIVVVVVATALLCWQGVDVLLPSPIEPVAFSYEAAAELSSVGSLRRNRLADGLVLLDFLAAPESFAVEPGTGRLYTGLATGAIVRTKSAQLGRTAADFELVCVTGSPPADVDCRRADNEAVCGRPLGMHFDGAGRLIVADARGLLAVDVDSGAVTVLLSSPLFPNSVVVHPADGTVYFTDSSARHRRSRVIYEVLEGRATGRLLAYHPANATTVVLADGLPFPNGLALARNNTALLLTSTTRSALYAYDLVAGRLALVRSDLPAIPDNISPSSSSSSSYWIGCTNLRSPLLQRLAAWPRLRRELARWLPPALFLHVQPSFGLVLEIDDSGRLLSALTADSPSPVAFISEAFEFDGKLLLGSFTNPFLAFITLPL